MTGITDMGQVLLTFDTEDFVSENSIRFLHSLLSCLRKFELKALFFVTGYMAEKLRNYAETVKLLEEHEIGYHSSSHSVHPTIFEFTDVESYEEAYATALKRETSHINPLNGQIEGDGGILAIRSLFSCKEITAYRAPGFCWSPPHSEALRDLGLNFDFSANIAPGHVFYKGLTFYPYPAVREWQGSLADYRLTISSALRRKITVMCLHPDLFVNQSRWDSIYHNGNPKRITCPHPRPIAEFKSMFSKFELFLKRIKNIEKTGVIKVTSELRTTAENLIITADEVERTYQHSVRWPRLFFGYEPRFLRNHFFEFFDIPPHLDR